MVTGKNGNELKEGGRFLINVLSQHLRRETETSRTSASMSFVVIELLAGSVCIAN